MFSRPRRTIGIDVGTHAVKVAQLAPGGGGYRLEKASLTPVDAGLLHEDAAAALEASLQYAIGAYSPRSAIVVGALSGQDTIIRYLRMPKMPEADLHAAVENEADQNIPFDLTEVVLDYDIVEEQMEGDELTLRVLLVAAKNEVIDQRVSLFRSADLQPHLLGVNTLALADCGELNKQLRPDETVALINIGAQTTNIHFCRDGVSNFTRDIARGGRELTNAIQKFFKVDYAEAERIKTSPHSLEEGGANLEEAGAGASTPSMPEEGISVLTGDITGTTDPDLAENEETKFANATRPVISRLIGEIKRSIDFYERQLYERPVERILLSGGTAGFLGLDQQMADTCGVAVEISDPIEALVVDERSPDVQDALNHREKFAVAVGLAARGMDLL